MQGIFWLLDKSFLILALIIAVVIHEYSHGWTADRLGDSTARYAGRLTLNPVPHIDPLGTIIFPIIILILSGGTATIGWAKPVPVNPYNFTNPDRDMLKVSAAGPASNFLIATAAALLLRLGGLLPLEIIPYLLAGLGSRINPFLSFLGYLIFINLLLGIFNLIPIPPLDGSKILHSLLPRHLRWWYSRIEPHGFLILLILFFFFDLFGKVVVPLINVVLRIYSLG
jgi:Zn-dependent protease